MGKKVEIKLGLDPSEAKKEAKKTSQQIKQTLEKDLNTSVPINVDDKKALSAIERVKAAEQERVQQSKKHDNDSLSAAQKAALTMEMMEKRKKAAAMATGEYRLKLEDQINKKLLGMQNVMKNYDSLASKYPNNYQGTNQTTTDAQAVAVQAKEMQQNISQMSTKELGALSAKLQELTYKDLAALKSAMEQLAQKMTKSDKVVQTSEKLDKAFAKMTASVEKAATALEKIVSVNPTNAKATPPVEKLAKVVETATKAVQPVTTQSTKAATPTEDKEAAKIAKQDFAADADKVVNAKVNKIVDLMNKAAVTKPEVLAAKAGTNDPQKYLATLTKAVKGIPQKMQGASNEKLASFMSEIPKRLPNDFNELGKIAARLSNIANDKLPTARAERPVVRDKAGNAFGVDATKTMNASFEQLDKALKKITTTATSSELEKKNVNTPRLTQLDMNQNTLISQFKGVLDHIQKVTSDTLDKPKSDKRDEKVANLRDIQYKISEAATNTANMTSEQMRFMSAQMTRMSSNTVREMERGLRAIEKMFQKMSAAANQSMKTTALNAELRRQTGEANLGVGVFRPRARSNTESDISSQGQLALPLPQEPLKLLTAGFSNITMKTLPSLDMAAKTASESMKQLSATIESSKIAQAWAKNADVKDFTTDYRGPLTRSQSSARHNYSPLLLNEGPQDTLARALGKIDLSAIDKLASRISAGNVVNPANVPGGVNNAQLAPFRYREIMDSIPNMDNELAHNMLALTKNMKFTSLEDSVRNIEKIFRAINDLMGSSLEKAMGSTDAATEASKEQVIYGSGPKTLSEIERERIAMENQLKSEALKQRSKDYLDNNGIPSASTQGSDIVARQSAAQQQLIASIQKVLAAFDSLSERIQNDSSISEAQKEQWKTNASSVHSTAKSVQKAAASALPEDTMAAADLIKEADVNDALRLKQSLESISTLLAQSKRTLLQQAKQDAAQTNANLKSTNKTLKEIMTQFTRSSKAAQFLSKSTEAADKAAKKLERSYKDVARVVQGIMISRIFYAGLQKITAMTSAVGQMIVQFEQAHIAMSVMLKDQEKAGRLMNELADFAAKTPLTNQQADKSAQMLLAYGFEAKNLMPVMRDLADATAAVGNPEAFESIARALGQINTKGKVSAEELRQLTEQGIPATKFLKEQLHLTEKEVKNIGKAGISAEAGISAILKGIQQNYGGAAEALSNTIGGRLSTIKDSILFIFKEALEPLSHVFNGVLKNMVSSLEANLKVLRESGIGGLFEKFIPPEMQESVRLFCANLLMLISIIKKLWDALAPIRSAFTDAFILTLNNVLPLINALVYALASMINFITQNATAMKLLTSALAGLAIGFLVSKIIMGLAKGFIFLKGVIEGVISIVIGLSQGLKLMSIIGTMTAGKLAAIIAVFVALIAVVAAAFGAFDGFFNSISNGFQKMFKVDSSKMFQKTMKDNVDIAGEFGEEFDKNGEALDEWGNKAKKNADKAKNALMTFDEVFTLSDPSAEGNYDDTTSIDDMIPDLNAGAMPDLDFGEIDWDDFFNMGDFMSNFDGLIEWFNSLGKYFTKEYWEGLKTGSPADVLFEDFGNIFGGIGEFFDGIAKLIAGVVTLDLPMLADGWKTVVGGLGDVARGTGDLVVDCIDGIFRGFDALLGYLLGDFWEGWKAGNANLGEDLYKTLGGLKEAWDGFWTFVEGLLTLDGAKISEGWKGLWNGLGDVATGIIDLILDGAGNLLDWFVDDFLSHFGWFGKQIKNLLWEGKEQIKAIMGNIKDIFGGVIDFLVGVFTGDWEKAWRGIVRAFKGVFGGVGNFFIGIINACIDAVNWLTTKISEFLSFEVPDWVPGIGGKGWTVDIGSIPRVPYFRAGGIITKDTLARIGEDNRKEGILPLESDSAMDLIADAITEHMPTPPGTSDEAVGGGDEINLNVGVLVADDNGIRKLKTMLDEVSEEFKRGRRG